MILLHLMILFLDRFFDGRVLIETNDDRYGIPASLDIADFILAMRALPINLLPELNWSPQFLIHLDRCQDQGLGIVQVLELVLKGSHLFIYFDILLGNFSERLHVHHGIHRNSQILEHFLAE